MGLVAVQAAAHFTLHIRCENCMRDSVSVMEVPAGDNVPQDADDLVGSAYLENREFRCRPCGSVIGIIVGIEEGVSYA